MICMSEIIREARGGRGAGAIAEDSASRRPGPSALLAISVVLFLFLFALRPLMVDGDGLGHATRAIYWGFLDGMYPQHVLAASLFRCVYLPLEGFGLRRYSIAAIATISNLSAVGVLLLLATSIYPRF